MGDNLRLINNAIAYAVFRTAVWLFIHGILTIIAAVNSKNKGAGTVAVILGVMLGVLDLLMCVCSVIYPAMLAFNLGILVGFYFVVSGINMVLIGSDISRAVAISREAQIIEAEEKQD